PASARAEASVTGRPSRLTRPSAISAWMRLRDSSGKRAASALSIRPPASSGESASRRTPEASASSASSSVSSATSAPMLSFGGLLATDDRAVLEQVLAQLAVEVRIVAAHPLEHHGGVLQLLVGVVQHDRLQLRVLDVVGALAIPVDGLELLDQRGDRIVHFE